MTEKSFIWGGITHAAGCYCGRCRRKRDEQSAPAKPEAEEASQHSSKERE